MPLIPFRGLRILYTVSLMAFGLGLLIVHNLTPGVPTQVYPNNSVDHIFQDFPLIVANSSEPFNPESEIPSAEEWLARRPFQFQLTFVAPEDYRGAKMEGWGPKRNRSVPLYVRPEEREFPMRPNRSVLSGCRVLVVVHSTLNSFDTRMDIRNSWMKFDGLKELGVSVIFLVGRVKTDILRSVGDTEQSLQTLLQEEQNTYGDILQADMIEHYHNLTLKSMFTLKFFLDSKNFKAGKSPKYLFKVDDDTFINLPSIWNTIETYEPRNSSRFIIGALMGNSRRHLVPLRMPDSRNKKRREQLKWWCPSYMYNGTYYPLFVSGSGYIVSREASECLYLAGLRLPYFHLEDVFLTGFAAEWCDVPRINSKYFHPQYPKIEKFDLKSDLHYHYILAKSKLLLFRMFNYDNLLEKYEKLKTEHNV